MRNAEFILFQTEKTWCKQAWPLGLNLSFTVCFLFVKVSFYRGAVPESIPEDASRRRKGPDSLWLATLPIKLPVSCFVSYWKINLDGVRARPSHSANFVFLHENRCNEWLQERAAQPCYGRDFPLPVSSSEKRDMNSWEWSPAHLACQAQACWMGGQRGWILWMHKGCRTGGSSL